MAINADKSRFLRTCNAKVEGSIPFTGTIHIKHLGQSVRVGLFAAYRRACVSTHFIR